MLFFGANEVVLSDGLEPINIPPYKSISVSEDGTIVVEPLGAEPGTIQNAGTIGSARDGTRVCMSNKALHETEMWLL